MVGLGEFGALHAETLAQSPLAALRVCCDHDAGREPFARALGARFAPDLRAALDEPGLEAVWCCTPPDTHREVVAAALERGLQVFCEKPLAASDADADALLAAAAASAGRLVVGHVYRFDPRFTELAAAVDDGRIGRVLDLGAVLHTPRADARRLGHAVTPTLENAVHLLDVFHWLAGPVERVHAEATRDGASVAATLRFAGGAVATLLNSWALADDAGIDWGFRLTCNGERGLATIDGLDRGVALYGAAAPFVHPNPISWPRVHGRIAGLVAAEDERFLLGVRDPAVDWPLDLSDARRALSTALAIDAAVAHGAAAEPR